MKEETEKKGENKVINIIVSIITLIIYVVVTLSIITLSWNYVMPDLFNLPTISYMQASALYVMVYALGYKHK